MVSSEKAADGATDSDDPATVMHLEWRRAFREDLKSLTSHSMLQAYLLDGQTLRFERFADRGLVISHFSPREVILDEGELFRGRVAAPADFARPLKAAELRKLALEISDARPYSVRRQNCHHFVRGLWNAVVCEKLRRHHYPDRMKVKMLRGVSKPLGLFGLDRLVASTSTASTSYQEQPDSSEIEEESCWSDEESKPDIYRQPSPPPVVVPSQITEQHTDSEVGRISGDFTSQCRADPDYEKSKRLNNFARILEAQEITLLQADGKLSEIDAPTWPPAPFDGTEEMAYAWASSWLPEATGACQGLAERITQIDAMDLVAKVFGQVGDPTLSSTGGFRDRVRERFSSVASTRTLESGTISDVSFVILQKNAPPTEAFAIGKCLRLAIYAIIQSANPEVPSRRLRLVSGNAHAGEEHVYAFTFLDLPKDVALPTAAELMKGELEALQTCVVTGDAGFVTLL